MYVCVVFKGEGEIVWGDKDFLHKNIIVVVVLTLSLCAVCALRNLVTN